MAASQSQSPLIDLKQSNAMQCPKSHTLVQHRLLMFVLPCDAMCNPWIWFMFRSFSVAFFGHPKRSGVHLLPAELHPTPCCQRVDRSEISQNISRYIIVSRCTILYIYYALYKDWNLKCYWDSHISHKPTKFSTTVGRSDNIPKIGQSQSYQKTWNKPTKQWLNH